MRELTRDKIFGGEITLLQHKKGYRFGTDALLLATDLPTLEAGDVVIELGAAHGAVAITIAASRKDVHVIAVERQEALADLLEQNIRENELENIEAVRGDLRDYREVLTGHSANLVVFNPPYFRPGERRLSSCEERAAAHHELHGTLEDFILAACYALKPGGYLKMIAPPMRMPDVFEAMSSTDFNLGSMRFFHTTGAREAYLVEYVLRRGGTPDFKVLAPLFLYEDDERDYTSEAARRLGSAARLEG
ncbi:MAG: tRNA1(Val) (adenine(37)-N6)-methyltransferase [Bradymonadaceae bacterium]